MSAKLRDKALFRLMPLLAVPLSYCGASTPKKFLATPQRITNTAMMSISRLDRNNVGSWYPCTARIYTKQNQYTAIGSNSAVSILLPAKPKKSPCTKSHKPLKEPHPGQYVSVKNCHGHGGYRFTDWTGKVQKRVVSKMILRIVRSKSLRDLTFQF